MYVVGTFYNKDLNAIGLKLLNKENVHVVYDKDFRPFFLSEEPVEGEGVIAIERVVRFDPLLRRERELKKVIVETPLHVRLLSEGRKGVYENKIKFHVNYLIEKGISPCSKLNKVYNDVKELFEEEVPTPPFVALDIEVANEENKVPDPNNPKEPIISVALSNGKTTIVLLNKEHVGNFKETKVGGFHVKVIDNECELIVKALSLALSFPILVTFNGDLFDLPYLLNRLRVLKCILPSRLESRLKVVKSDKVNHVVSGEEYQYYIFETNVNFDLFPFFGNSSIQNYTFGKAYDELSLDAIGKALLNVEKVKLDKPIPSLSPKELVLYNGTDAMITALLFSYDEFLPWRLSCLLARVTMTPLEELIRTPISRWIANLFFYVHRKKNYLIPNKEDLEGKGNVVSESTSGKSYKGARVIEPPAGVFFNVSVLDFASLYPSIIDIFNVSYDTINVKECKNKVVVPEVGHVICNDYVGIASEVVRQLKDLRLHYKRLAKVNKDYNAIQLTLKVLINAMYGVFGNKGFALYCPPVAESITAFGRHIHERTERLIKEKYKVPILYGDTDSIFLWTDKGDIIDKVIKDVKDTFNVELEKDKVYRLVLFTSNKKNYVGVTNEGKLDVKGLVGKKRNVPPIIARYFSKALEAFKEVKSPEDVFKAKRVIEEVYDELLTLLEGKKVRPEDLRVKVAINKPLEEYKVDAPHVKVARILSRREGIKVTKNTVVEFVYTPQGPMPLKYVRSPRAIDSRKYVEQARSIFSQLERGLGKLKRKGVLHAFFG